jgi:hypothetical protein
VVCLANFPKIQKYSGPENRITPFSRGNRNLLDEKTVRGDRILSQILLLKLCIFFVFMSRTEDTPLLFLKFQFRRIQLLHRTT